jgi:hypothetical protein
MPLKPSERAEACRRAGLAYELCQQALLLSDGEEQFEAWRGAAMALGMASYFGPRAVQEADRQAKRGRR